VPKLELLRKDPRRQGNTLPSSIEIRKSAFLTSGAGSTFTLNASSEAWSQPE
jgi:hypothetical protein